MLLSEIKDKYLSDLEKLYPPQEIACLFEWLAEHYLSVTKIRLHQLMSKNTSPDAEKKMLASLKRLYNAEPIQYILGFTEFYNLHLNISPDVLIPRAETEYLVDLIIKDLPDITPITIADLCTGSGCIAIALAKNIQEAKVVASDISENALRFAKKNAAKNNVDIDFKYDDVLNSCIEQTFDVIVSNPPYVRNQEKQFMHNNVLDYEPWEALFVNDHDPLVFYKAIAKFALKNLIRGGLIYLEINEYLGADMRNLYVELGFTHVQIINDLDGKERFLKAIR